MPYPRHKTFQKWEECRICGFDYPKSQLTKDSFGSKRCPLCMDQDGTDEYKKDLLIRMEEDTIEEQEVDLL